MTARRAIVLAGLVVLGLAGAYALWGAGRSADPVAARGDVEAEKECDSCSARKKDMARLREVLNPPDTAQD